MVKFCALLIFDDFHLSLLQFSLGLLGLTIAILLLPSFIHLFEPSPQVLDRDLPSIRVLFFALLELGPVAPRQVVYLIIKLELKFIVVLEVMFLIIEVRLGVADDALLLFSHFILQKLILLHK